MSTRSIPVTHTHPTCAAAVAVAAACLLALAPGRAGAQGLPTSALDSASLAALQWRPIGPAKMGGRVADLAVVEGNASTFYVGLATGGVWRTTSHGASWTPLFDDQETASIGDVTLAPSNPKVVYVGTGEPQNRQSSPWGNGVYRSVDGGRSWSHRGLEETRHIARIVVHPRDPDVAYVAAVGHLWGPNPERGVYRTRDGGRTWELVLFVNEDTGAIDMAMDPQDPETLFAAMYQRRRTNFGFNGGGPGGGIYRTLDGGGTWEKLTRGLPSGDVGRIGLDIYRRDGDIVYAIVEARPGRGRGVYRSTDRGDTWEMRGEYNPRPMYYSQLRIDPNDPQRVYSLGTQLRVSEDGGENFERVPTQGVHVDHHAMWIDPSDSRHIILGNDGGIYASFDRGQTWHTYNNLAIGQFYEIGIGMEDPYQVCGGLQDNGTWCGPSETYGSDGILNGHWREINGGDGFYAEIDPNDPAIVFAESQNGFLARVNLAWGEGAWIRPVDRRVDEAEATAAEEAEEEDRLRWNWNSPIVMSVHDSRTIYYGANVVFRSPDRGQTWEEISPDLTRNLDRDTLRIMGRLLSDTLLSRNDGISSYGNITTISESRSDPQLLYVGTDDGNVQRTRDGGATWTDLTPNFRGLPEQTYVSRLVASRHSPGRVYAAFDGHTNDDYAPYVYISEDYGQSWRPIVAGLPQTSVNVIAEDLRNPALLFLGNEVGVFFSTDRGASWARLGNGLPTVPVDDMELHPRENDLVIGTHGRSVWILDDLAPLQEMTGELLASTAHLFAARDARIVNRNNWEARPAGRFSAPNPPDGAVIRYYLGRDLTGGPDEGEAIAAGAEESRAGGGNRLDRGDGPGGRNGALLTQEERGGERGARPRVTLTVLGPDGDTVRELEGPGTRGLHQMVWDLRIEPPYEPEGQQGGFFGAVRGPRVVPGAYTVRLAGGGETVETPLTVEKDPRVDVSPAELEARWEASMQLYALAKPLYEANRALDRIGEQLEEADKLVGAHDDAPETLTTEIGALHEAHEELDDDLGEVSGDVRRLGFFLDRSSSPPTTDQLWQLERAWEKAPGLVERVNRLVTERMPALYAQMNEHGIRPDPGEAVTPPVRPPGSR